MNNQIMEKNTQVLRPSPDALLNPKVDPIFKSLFTQNSMDSNKALTAFLSALLGQKITDVALGQNELPIESERDKQSIFDLTCKSETQDKMLNVEMQGKNVLDSFDNRSEYHVAHLLNHFVTKGMSWADVPEAVMISVLNFVYDESKESGLLNYTMRLEDGTGLKSARMKIIYLELPKFKDIPDMPLEKLTAVEKWAKFFLYADCREKTEYVKKLAESEDGIMYAQNALNSISQSDAEWRRERDYWDAVATENTIRIEATRKGLAEGRQLGFEQGIEEGRKKGFRQGIQQGIQQGIKQGQKEKAIETARNFKNNGVSVDIIAKCTGLSVEEIECL